MQKISEILPEYYAKIRGEAIKERIKINRYKKILNVAIYNEITTLEEVRKTLALRRTDKETF